MSDSDRVSELELENAALHARIDDDLLPQLEWNQAELARTQAEMAGLTSALLNIQDKLRDAENALSEKQAAARQAEEVSANYGLMTLLAPKEGEQ